TELPLANQISCSWRYGIDDNTDQIMKVFIAQGQSFLTSSGDNAAYRTVPTEKLLEANQVTVVGGTTLTMTGLGSSYQSETTWNSGGWLPQTGLQPVGTGAAGGGFLGVGFVPIPDYQGPFVNASNQASTVSRNLPDVSMVTAMEMDFGGKRQNFTGT